jgi:shikimate dehydrogenase
MKKLLGLIGYPLEHSFSPGYFREKFRREQLREWDYQAFPLQSPDELLDLVRNHPALQGLNVTIPYKEAVIPFLDALDEEAAAIGAVNTILRMEDGRLKGFNTDAPAFRQVLAETKADRLPAALVLGSGGASRAVRHVLEGLGIPFRQVSRTSAPDRYVYRELTEDILAAHPLIVQTTPLGMYPHEEARPPLPYHAIGTGHFLFDLIYNPPETLFLQAGRKQGAGTINGLKMLYLQAEMSWSLWTGKS